MKPHTVQDLHDAFVGCLARPAPSHARCREILRAGGWTAESAAQSIDTHPYFIDRLMRTTQSTIELRRRIATLDDKAS